MTLKNLSRLGEETRIGRVFIDALREALDLEPLYSKLESDERAARRYLMTYSDSSPRRSCQRVE